MKQNESPLEKFEEAVEGEAQELKREYKRFERFRDENSLLLGVFVFGLAALVLINTLFWVQFTRHRSATENKVTTTVANLSASTTLQTAHNFAMTAKVSNAGTKTEQDRAFPIEDGQTLLVMDITVTNQTNRNQQLIPVSQLYIRTSTGEYATLYPSSKISNPLMPTDLKSGQSASGQLSFAVSERTTKPLLYIDTQWDSSTPLVIDVLH